MPLCFSYRLASCSCDQFAKGTSVRTESGRDADIVVVSSGGRHRHRSGDCGLGFALSSPYFACNARFLTFACFTSCSSLCLGRTWIFRTCVVGNKVQIFVYLSCFHNSIFFHSHLRVIDSLPIIHHQLAPPLFSRIHINALVNFRTYRHHFQHHKLSLTFTRCTHHGASFLFTTMTL